MTLETEHEHEIREGVAGCQVCGAK